jgi:hypothetical protein
LLKSSPNAADLLELVAVEHTSFDHPGARTDLPAQLSKTKFKAMSLPADDYVLLVEIKALDEIDIAAIQELMLKWKIGYKVLLMQGRVEDGAEVIRVVKVDEAVREMSIDPKTESERFPDHLPQVAFKRRGVRLVSEARPPKRTQPYPWPDPFNFPY